MRAADPATSHDAGGGGGGGGGTGGTGLGPGTGGDPGIGAPAPRKPKSASPRQRVVAGYVLGHVLGQGTFGKVRAATKNGDRFAVKILERSRINCSEWTGKVHREVAIMRALDHPSIVRLHQVIRSPSRVYLVMELVPGGELYYKVQNEGALPEATARLYFQQLVDGIAYCHSRGVYHRDLKPENLLLSADGKTLKVTDFGLSAVNPKPAEVTLLRTACGSPHYCAPEVRGRRSTDGYSGSAIDAWSCGVILFLLCTGWLPFHDDDERKLQNLIDSASVQYPSMVPRGAREICDALLEKDPARRATLAEIRQHPWFRMDYRPALHVPRPSLSRASAPAIPSIPPLPEKQQQKAPPRTRRTEEDEEPQPSVMLPTSPRSSVPYGRAPGSLRWRASRRRRLKSALHDSVTARAMLSTSPPITERRCSLSSTGVPPVSVVSGSSSGNGAGDKPAVTESSPKSVGVALARAPSLVLGDAPASPRSVYDTQGLASSSLSSSRSSMDVRKSNNKGGGNVGAGEEKRKRKAVLSLRMFAMGDVMRDFKTDDEKGTKTSSQRFRTFGARMLSNLGPRQWARAKA